MVVSLRRVLPLVAVCALFVVPATAAAENISDAQASPGKASGAAIDYPGVLTVNKSESGKGEAKATVLAVGGMDLLAHENGAYTGPLAPVGALTGELNQALCPGGPLAGYCLVILHAGSNELSDPELGAQSSASTTLVGVSVPGDGINVAGSATGSNYNAFTGTCNDLAAGYLLITNRQFQDPALLNNILRRKASSLNQPCDEEGEVG